MHLIGLGIHSLNIAIDFMGLRFNQFALLCNLFLLCEYLFLLTYTQFEAILDGKSFPLTEGLSVLSLYHFVPDFKDCKRGFSFLTLLLNQGVNASYSH